MEKLIVIAVIVVGSLIHNWIQRKQQEAEEAREAQRPRPPAPPLARRGGGVPPTVTQQVPPPPPLPRSTSSAPETSAGGGGLDWEAELRRLLQGERPTPVPPVPAPPPVPSAPPPFLARSSIPVPDEGMEMEVGLPVRPADLGRVTAAHDRATAAHDRAFGMQANVAQRMADAATRVTSHSGPAGNALPAAPVPSRMARLLRDREAQRTAIVASVILGPPRALESEPALRG